MVYNSLQKSLALEQENISAWKQTSSCFPAYLLIFICYNGQLKQLMEVQHCNWLE